MGLLSNWVKRTEIEAGDHIYTWRAVYTYSHHGIYVGDEKVVHFTRKNEASSGFTSWSPSSSSSSSAKFPSACLFPDCGFQKPDSGVMFSCLDCFLDNGSLHKYMYGVSRYMILAKIRGGTCTTAKSDPPQAVIDRAMFLLENGFGNYDLFGNNCEDFALYCKTGLLPIKKNQGVGGSGQASSMLGMPLSAILSTPLRLFGSGPVGMATAAVGMYYSYRLGSDIGVGKDAGDMIKVPVEDLAEYLGGICPSEEGTKEEGSTTSATLDFDTGSLALQPSVNYSKAPPAPSQSDTSTATPPDMLSMHQMSTMMYEFQRQLKELKELHVAPPVTRPAP
ncbi:uncharacterized protein M6B38_348910 [Iris pallida]|uniref:LRAT domain-containing protein n=1 Tax=Iris pallida TaxID=29817 RepID=A0AAX6GSD2_IRIPA|nr:uncharacterized protein M6B38_348910 [Iris pallida]